MNYKVLVYIAVVASIVIMSCQNPTSRPAPDVSDVKVEVDLIRYDAGLANIDPEKAEASYVQLLTAYPKMTDLYFKELVKMYTPDKKVYYERISEFAKEERIVSLLDTIEHIFPYDDKTIAQSIEQPLKYLKHYFPEKEIADYIAKKSIEMVVVDILGNPTGKRFIDRMIYHGKKAYVMAHLFPSTTDTILWEYTSPQMDWVKDNELEIWSYFLEKELLYETNHLEIAHYIESAPTSKGMPKVAPGRTGVYSGYKIIESFMDRNPDFTIKDLIEHKDAQRLLEQSKYKPSRR